MEFFIEKLVAHPVHYLRADCEVPRQPTALLGVEIGRYMPTPSPLRRLIPMAESKLTPIPELYALTAEWAILRGAERLNEQPGPWEAELGEFRVAINAHADEQKTSEGLTVPPFHFVFNAPKYLFAVMLVGPSGGFGSQGMEADVIAALNADISALRQQGGSEHGDL